MGSAVGVAALEGMRCGGAGARLRPPTAGAIPALAVDPVTRNVLGTALILSEGTHSLYKSLVYAAQENRNLCSIMCARGVIVA